MLKHQRFDDNNIEKRALRVYKCQRIDGNDDKEKELDKYKGEVNGYIPFPPTTLVSPPQKELNRLSEIWTTHLVCIPKTDS